MDLDDSVQMGGGAALLYQKAQTCEDNGYEDLAEEYYEMASDLASIRLLPEREKECQ